MLCAQQLVPSCVCAFSLSEYRSRRLHPCAFPLSLCRYCHLRSPPTTCASCCTASPAPQRLSGMEIERFYALGFFLGRELGLGCLLPGPVLLWEHCKQLFRGMLLCSRTRRGL